MTENNRDSGGGQVRLLLGGLVLIAGLLTIATVAATQPWLSLLASGALFAVGLGAVRRDVPRLFVVITLGFAVVLAGITVLQWGAEETPATADAEPAAASGPTLLSGTVTDAGTPLAGVPLRVTLWPDNEDSEVGQTVDTRALPRSPPTRRAGTSSRSPPRTFRPRTCSAAGS